MYITLCSCALVCGERNGLFGSCTDYVGHAHTIHESVVLRYTEAWQACTMTVQWGKMLNFDLHFICNTMMIFFFLQKFSDTFHVQKYLRFLSKHTRVCVLFLLMMGKTNENLPLLDRARKKRKMKCKSSYINDPNCNLQFRIELPLQIERLGDYSFCVYLNKPNASLKRKEAQ